MNQKKWELLPKTAVSALSLTEYISEDESVKKERSVREVDENGKAKFAL